MGWNKSGKSSPVSASESGFPMTLRLSTLKLQPLFISHHLMHRKPHSRCFSPSTPHHQPSVTSPLGLKSLIFCWIQSKPSMLALPPSSQLTAPLLTKSYSFFQILLRPQTLPEQPSLTPIPASSSFSHCLWDCLCLCLHQLAFCVFVPPPKPPSLSA